MAEYIYENRVAFTSSYIISDDYFEIINKPYELITGISNNFNNINVELLLKLDKNLKQELTTINKELKQHEKAVKEVEDNSKDYKSILKQFVKCNKDKKNCLL